MAKNLERFGFVLPILVDPKSRVVAGWALLLAALQLGLTEIPAVIVTDLSEAELRALRLALNRLSEDAGWDDKELALEFSDILELAPQLELEVTGFETGQIDVLLDDGGRDEEDELPQIDPAAEAVTRPGDLWVCGTHRVLCNDAREADSYARVLGNEKADMLFADPPYNVPIEGHASGLGLSGIQILPWRQVSFPRPTMWPSCGGRSGMRPTTRSTAQFILCVRTGATPKKGSLLERKSIVNSRTSAFGANPTPA